MTDDRPGRRPLPDAERPLARFNFRSVAPDIRGPSQPKRRPGVGYKGYYRRALRDGSNQGDALNEYEGWVMSGNGGSDVMNEFMNLTGAQMDIVLSEFTSGNQGLANDQVAFFAASASNSSALSADSLAIANDVLPTLLGDLWSKGGQAEWQALSPDVQLPIAQAIIASQNSDGSFSINKDTLALMIDKAYTAQGKNSTLWEIVGVLVGAMVVVGGVVLVVSRI